MKQDRFKDIRAYRVGFILPFFDFLFSFPLLWIWACKTSKGIRLDYMGDRKTIDRDIKHGAFFMTNHRDIVLDAAWLSLLLRFRYFSFLKKRGRRPSEKYSVRYPENWANHLGEKATGKKPIDW